MPKIYTLGYSGRKLDEVVRLAHDLTPIRNALPFPAGRFSLGNVWIPRRPGLPSKRHCGTTSSSKKRTAPV